MFNSTGGAIVKIRLISGLIILIRPKLANLQMEEPNYEKPA